MSRPYAHRGLTPNYIKLLRTDPCSYCGGKAGTVDHIESILRKQPSRILATGFSVRHWTNLTAACTKCNSSKGAQSLLSFLIELAENRRKCSAKPQNLTIAPRHATIRQPQKSTTFGVKPWSR